MSTVAERIGCVAEVTLWMSLDMYRPVVGIPACDRIIADFLAFRAVGL